MIKRSNGDKKNYMLLPFLSYRAIASRGREIHLKNIFVLTDMQNKRANERAGWRKQNTINCYLKGI